MPFSVVNIGPILGYFWFFSKTAHREQSHWRRKFAQSSHPASDTWACQPIMLKKLKNIFNEFKK
jgi:hypothetical protein